MKGKEDNFEKHDIIILERRCLMKTPHIESDKGEIAKIVLMPGDPLRAKFIKEHYLEDAKLVNTVRNILAYTGFYKGNKVTVFASGMGIPSMAIYAYELFQFYDVEKIIRIGSVGSLKEDMSLYDIIVVEHSYTDSNFAQSFSSTTTKCENASKNLNDQIIKTAEQKKLKIHVGDVFCSDSFYHSEGTTPSYPPSVLGVEMESFALFHIAKVLNKEAATILTVSDSIITKEVTTSEEREKSFTDMITLALDSSFNKN